jgi:hypothetical protein
MGDPDQSRQRIGRMFDIGIGQPKITRRPGLRDTLMHGPELSGPARAQRRALTTVSRSEPKARARSPVPSSELSSTSTMRNAPDNPDAAGCRWSG